VILNKLKGFPFVLLIEIKNISHSLHALLAAFIFIFFGHISFLLAQVAVGKLPVDQGPPSIDEIGALVSVVDVVGMLPNVNDKNRLLVFRQRIPGIMCAHHLKLAVGVLHKPSPAGAEMSGSGGIQLLLEDSERSKVAVDQLLSLSNRFVASFW